MDNTTDVNTYYGLDLFSDDFSSSDQWPTGLFLSIGASVMVVFFVEALFGNIWIILAIAYTRKFWNITNIFIISMCANDLTSLFLVVVFIIDSYVWQRWRAGPVLCKLNPEFTVAFTGSSLWHTALIAVHRYLVVVHNNLYKRMSKRSYVLFVLITARAIPFACTFPGFNMETSGYVPKLLRCIFLPDQTARIVSVTMVQILMPSVITLICYILIFIYVYRSRTHSTCFLVNREIVITKMFGIIFLIILIGFMPYIVLRNLDKANKVNADIYVIVTVCYSIATCSNPIVYGAMSTDIRAGCMSTYKRGLSRLKLWFCGQISDESEIEDEGLQMETCDTERATNGHYEDCESKTDLGEIPVQVTISK